jgi:hypothetical protein
VHTKKIKQLQSSFRLESTEDTEIGKKEGFGSDRNPTLSFLVRLCDLCGL